MVENSLPSMLSSKNNFVRYSQLHRKIRKNGWVHVRTSGSHYIYEKNGRNYPAAFHCSKEVPKGMQIKIVKDMELK